MVVNEDIFGTRSALAALLHATTRVPFGPHLQERGRIVAGLVIDDDYLKVGIVALHH